MPVFEASESIVSTFQALILVLILVVLDSVSPSVLNPSRRKCRSMTKGKSFILSSGFSASKSGDGTKDWSFLASSPPIRNLFYIGRKA